MSLRQLQKIAGPPGGEQCGAGGRGRGRAQRMSLHEFQRQPAAGVPARSRAAAPSAWGAAPPAAAAPRGELSAWGCPAPAAAEWAAEAPADADAAAGRGAPSQPRRRWGQQEAACAASEDGLAEDGAARSTGDAESAAERSEEELLALQLERDVGAWLQELSLPGELSGPLLAWCREMGAATLGEVVDSVDVLAEAIDLKRLQKMRLLKKASEAFAAVCAKAPSCAQGGAAPAAALAPPGVGAQGGVAGTSFYSSGAVPTQASSAASSAQTFYERGGAGGAGAEPREPGAPGCEAEAAGPGAEPDVYLKQRPTERATFAPAVKVGQGARKRQERAAPDRRDEAAEAAGAAEETRRRAEEKFAEEEALKEELQELLRLPHGPAFGAEVRRLLQAAGSNRWQEVVAAEQALLEWERQQDAKRQEAQRREQLRKEAEVALRMAMRYGEAEALEVALESARDTGLPDSHQLVAEAVQFLQSARERERLDAEAASRLERALGSGDPSELEQAIASCQQRRLPLRGAEERLERLHAEARQREEALARLRDAVEQADAAAVRDALSAARAAGAGGIPLAAAEARLCELEAAEARRRAARAELGEARAAGSAPRLELALERARGAGVEAPALLEAEAELRGLRESATRREGARAALVAALAAGGPPAGRARALRAALEAAEAALDGGGAEATEARSLLARLERERLLEEEAALHRGAEAAVRAAAADGRERGPLEAGRQHPQEPGCPEGCRAAQVADLAPAGLVEGEELEKARLGVQDTEERRGELEGCEAIDRERQLLRGSEEYTSAERSLKGPQEERRLREATRADRQRRAAEEEEERRRQAQSAEELRLAMGTGDEDAVRALLGEDVLTAGDSEAAEAYLTGRQQRREAAEGDSTLLEFHYAALDRRAFFQASVSLNHLFAERWSMQEGVDFKLRQVNACNSVLVAFRGREAADAVRAAMAEMPPGGANPAASAEVKAAPDFSDRAAEILPAMRQEAASLRLRPENPAAQPAAAPRGAAAQDSASPGLSGGYPAKGAGRSGGAGGGGRAAGGPADHGRRGAPAPAHAPGAEGTGRGGGWGEGRAAPAAWDSGPGPGGGARGRAWGEGAPAAAVAPPGASARCGLLVVPLPPGAAARLRAERDAEATLQSDLQTFALKFGVSAELRGGEAIALRPAGWQRDPEAVMQDAQRELQGLLDYHFPSQVLPREESRASAPVRGAVPERRYAYLRVDAQHGAGIDIAPVAAGYRVDYVEDFPGQAFAAGDVIAEVDGRRLGGLTDEAMEATFGECFRDGAALVLIDDPGA